MIKAKYRHTNIVSRDWQKLARFYEQVFGCVRVFPERHHSGEWLAKGTGIANAELSGVHLRLPCNGENGPTLEIFQYSQNEPKLPPVANREGFSHIAFEVDDVERAMNEVLKHGGKKVGDMASSEVKGIGILSFVYVADPEGNIIELQSWKQSTLQIAKHNSLISGNMMMRMILVGQGPFGEKLLKTLIERGEQIVGVFSPPDKRGEAMKELAERSRIAFFHPPRMKKHEVYDLYVKLRPDLVILAFVTDIIPEKLLEIPSLGTICYHPSLLPRHRGASAINWAILMGETHTGLTVFWVDKGIDTGPILLQKGVEIGPNDTAGSLYFNVLFPMGVNAMVEAVELIKEGKAPRIPQDDSKATYEPPCDDKVAAVDFEKPMINVYNLIRGCDPQPGSYTSFRGEKVRLYDARIQISTEKGKRNGEIISFDKEGLQVSVSGGIIKIGKFRVEKGEKIGAMEFAQSVDLKVGDRLGN